MAGGGSAAESGEPEFQVAPMIDVLLVILIFFMTITSAQVLKVDQKISLPIAANAGKKDDARAEAILNIRWNKATKTPQFVLEEKIYAQPNDLIEPLKVMKKTGETSIAASKNPNFRGVIRGDRELPAIHVSRAMNACAEAGISEISFAAVNRD